MSCPPFQFIEELSKGAPQPPPCSAACTPEEPPQAGARESKEEKKCDDRMRANAIKCPMAWPNKVHRKKLLSIFINRKCISISTAV